MTTHTYSKQDVLAMMASLSEADLAILQNDTLARDPEQKSLIPEHLAQDFSEWLRDSFGPVERETMMAPENQRETEERFLQETGEQRDARIA